MSPFCQSDFPTAGADTWRSGQSVRGLLLAEVGCWLLAVTLDTVHRSSRRGSTKKSTPRRQTQPCLQPRRLFPHHHIEIIKFALRQHHAGSSTTPRLETFKTTHHNIELSPTSSHCHTANPDRQAPSPQWVSRRRLASLPKSVPLSASRVSQQSLTTGHTGQACHRQARRSAQGEHQEERGGSGRRQEEVRPRWRARPRSPPDAVADVRSSKLGNDAAILRAGRYIIPEQQAASALHLGLGSNRAT